MGDEDSTGLIDVSEIGLDDLKLLQIPAITRALQSVSEATGTVAKFQSAT